MVPNQESEGAAAQMLYCFWPKNFGLHGRNEQEHCHDETASFFLSTCLAAFFTQYHKGVHKSSVKMEWTDPLVILTSSTIFLGVRRRSSITIWRTFSITSSFRLVDDLPDRASISTDIRRFLKQLNHSFI